MTQPTRARRGVHPANVVHLVFGVLFLGLATTWLLRATGAVTHDELGWLVPLTPIVAGVVGLATAALARRRPSVSAADPTTRLDPEEQP